MRPPPPHGEVQPGAACLRWSESMEMAEQELNEKVVRLAEILASGGGSRLPDGGAKVRQNIADIQAELDRRRGIYRHVAAAARDTEKCERADGRDEINAETSGRQIESNSKQSLGHSTHMMANEPIDHKENGQRKPNVFDVDGNTLNDSNTPKESSLKDPPLTSVGDFAREDETTHYSQDIADSFHSQSRDSSLCTVSGKREGDFIPRRSLRVASKKAKSVHFIDEEAQENCPSQSVDISSQRGKKVYFPSKEDPDSVELFYEDLKRLDGKSYLSSSIMNFYIKYMQSAASANGLRGEYHFFNTFFYGKLEETMSLKGDDDVSYMKLRRWWKGVDIFHKAYIFVPVYGEMHWSLVIICIPAHVDKSGPVILHLDSLNLHNGGNIMGVIKKFLIKEWSFLNASCGTSDLPISEDIWNNLPNKILKKKIKVPQQKNEYDCGLFVLYFMERFLEAAPERLSKKDISMFGAKWFQPEEASALRNLLLKLLTELFESTEDAPSTSTAGDCAVADSPTAP